MGGLSSNIKEVADLTNQVDGSINEARICINDIERSMVETEKVHNELNTSVGNMSEKVEVLITE